MLGTLPCTLTTVLLPFLILTLVFDNFGAVVTDILVVSFLPLVSVAVTVVLPLFKPVTTPLLLTFATLFFLSVFI